MSCLEEKIKEKINEIFEYLKDISNN